MNTLHIIQGKDAVITSNETNDVTYAKGLWFSDIVERAYVAPFDCEVRYKLNGKTMIKKASKGDVILQFRDRSYFKEKVAVVKNEELKLVFKNQIDRDKEVADSYVRLHEQCENCKVCDA